MVDGLSFVIEHIYGGGGGYWICDYIGVKESLDYTGSIHQIRRWSQELFGYEFAIIHRAASMMKDVDGLSRHIDILIHGFLTQANRMRVNDIALRSFAYSYDLFNTVPTNVVSLFPTLLYPLKHIPSFLHFPLFIIFQFTLLPNLLFNHIQF